MIKGYKITNPDYTCRGMLFEAGKTYKQEGELKLCNNGFHFCVKPSKCFDYYSFDSNNHVFEIETPHAIGDENDKMCCLEITILRELSWEEVLKICNNGINNTGINNTGDKNTGNWNTGHWNTGHWNTGHWNTGESNTGESNTGDRNTGHRNTGHRNTGNSNTGHRNTGHRNTGNSNTGHRNTGHWNTANKSNGVFCEKESCIKIFDIDSKMTLSEFENSKYYKALNNGCFELTQWSEEENKTIAIDFKTACKNWWKSLSESDKKIIQEIPNFNKAKFYRITGIKL